MKFLFDNNVSVKVFDGASDAVVYAVKRFMRDISMTVSGKSIESNIVLEKAGLAVEAYEITADEKNMTIKAGDELGFIYALLHISSDSLGILPFWFWNDQRFDKKEYAEAECGTAVSEPYAVRLRGWFINDEVLFMKWKINGDDRICWEMAMEALLRCGGNLVIPGTDKNSRINREMAAKMGLWITHHHAEPLGAEMFSRAYPELTPSYAEHKELYHGLWKEALKIQKNNKVIWTLGFRGQGDVPFWKQDESYNTDEKRGRLISDVIKLQYDMVKEEYPDGICCTNLYGEIMDLYKKGCITLPEDVITIWADNGYGKMVSRRQGNENPRVTALPGEAEKNGHHGTYYHVSFYDLQAANHITMLPNTMEFVEKELKGAWQKGIKDMWIINCSNVKPHTLYLEEIRRLWKGDNVSADKIRKDYVHAYYPACDTEMADCIADCYAGFAENSVVYGKNEDEHGGEQLTNYVTRILIWAWRKNITECVKPLLWAAGEKPFAEQIKWYRDICLKAAEPYRSYVKQCEKCADALSGSSKELFEDSVMLQARVYLYCLEGALLFCESYEAFANKEYLRAFYLAGQSADMYQAGDNALRSREHDKWEGFYYNECLTDVKFTAYELRQLMGYIRNNGDGPSCFKWLRQVMYSAQDRKVALISHIDNHPSDEELYEAMKKQTGRNWNEELKGISDAD